MADSGVRSDRHDLDPGADAVRSMDRQVVDDHEQLARGLADQALQEIEKDRRLDGALIDHETQLAPIPFTLAGKDCRLPV